MINLVFVPPSHWGNIHLAEIAAAQKIVAFDCILQEAAAMMWEAVQLPKEHSEEVLLPPLSSEQAHHIWAGKSFGQARHIWAGMRRPEKLNHFSQRQ